MSNLRNIYRNTFLVLISLRNYNAFANYSCEQVSPTEYAYESNSVHRSEKQSANCMAYPAGGQVANLHLEHYTHCDGTQLRLTDSDLGSEQYSSSDHYVWRVGATSRHLLFIFPTRVNLTTVKLHYYSDSVRGLPRLRFYAVPYDFNIWDAPTASYSSVQVAAVPPGGELAGHNNVITNFNFSTIRVLMVSLNNAFEFAVSEVKFAICNGSPTSNLKNNTSNSPGIVYTTVGTLQGTLKMNKNITRSVELFQHSTSTYNIVLVTENSQPNIVLPVVLTAAIVLTIVLVVVLALLLLLHRKRNHNVKTNVELEATYSTLDRGTKQQIEPQTLDTSADLYDKIQLSPSTGQSEPISKTESKNACTFTSPTTSTSVYHNTEKQHERETERIRSEYTTYAVVDKNKKKKPKLEDSKECQDNTSGRGTLDKQLGILTATDPEESSYRSDAIEKLKTQQCQRNETIEDVYAVVQKKPKKREEETPPPIPEYTIESLYTAVEKVKITKDV